MVPLVYNLSAWEAEAEDEYQFEASLANAVSV